jgi:ferredoxin
MTMLLTTLGLIVLTSFFVYRHMRHAPSEKAISCPRCHAKVPPGASRCPRCDVPMQLYEVVAARAVVEDAGSPHAGGKPHAVVRADLCVGCGACVPVCPEPGAIKMVGKLATVNASLCAGHGKCVEACPVGGIVLATGASVHRVEVPDLDLDFESNLRGVYIVGELGGRGLINARSTRPRSRSSTWRRSSAGPAAGRRGRRRVRRHHRGSGPAGLSAGLEALRLGLRYLVLEQGVTGGHHPEIPAREVPPRRACGCVVRNLWVSDSSKEQLLQAWERIIARTGLRCARSTA